MNFKKIKYYCFFICLLTSVLMYAQDIEVKGKVIAEGLPLPGANIIIKGTSQGTQTDIEGNFTINTDAKAILTISYLGYNTKEVAASTSLLNIELTVNEDILDEVIVVAQGISKDKKALGYAVSKVNKEETENRAETDVTRILQGKISGVKITPSSGSSGSVPSIRIRSNVSLTGANSALLIVDNVPFFGSLIDLNPNDIEDVTILKGLNAAVLYGNDGRNGVVLVTTKNGSAKIGKKSFTASVSQTTYTNSAANLPNFQNIYGVGNNLVTDASTIGNNGSNGARFDSLDFIPHPLSNDARFPEFSNEVVPYQAYPNNVNDFFNTGIGQNTTLSISATGENSSINVSTGYSSEEGIIGNNGFKRFNFNFGGTTQLSDKLKLSTSVIYNIRERTSQNDEDLFDNLYKIPRSLDIHNLPFQDALGANVNYINSFENPLWIINNTGSEFDRNRLATILNLEYRFNDNLSLKYRGGFQNEEDSAFDYRNKGGLGSVSGLGTLDFEESNQLVIDNTLILGYKKKLTKTINFDAQIGANSRFERGKSISSEYNDQIVYDFFRPNNFKIVGQGSYSNYKENLIGVFGQFGFDYNQYLFINFSGRYDKSSTLESENQSLFYPGAALSFIPTSAFENFGGNTINYLKFRFAYATSAGFPGRYSTRPTLASDPREFQSENGELIITNSVFSELPNPDLKPELHKEFELGLEAKLFNNTISLEASVFSRISTDQIFDTELAPGTGYTTTTINAGRLDSEGMEIDLGIKLFKNSAFNWNIRNTYTSFRSTVVELPDGITQLGDIIVGEELGVRLGSYIVRDSAGNALIEPNSGQVITSEDVGLQDKIIANVRPDWRASSIHTLNYKNFTFSAQFEYTSGGDTDTGGVVEQLLERGVTTDTENREGSFVIPGVLGDVSTGEPILDANGNTIPNTIQTSGNNAIFNNFYEADETQYFDASVFRIREISLGYSFSKQALKKSPFSGLDIKFSARNLFYYAPNIPQGTNFDPETNGFGVPTTKRYALSVTFNF